MYVWICDICGREKPEYQIKPPYSEYSSLAGSYCPFCHRNTYDHPVDENGERVTYPIEKPSNQDRRLCLDNEEYMKMRKKWTHVIERNMKIMDNDNKQMMDYVSNIKNIRQRKR
jgi:hypothetical protein